MPSCDSIVAGDWNTVVDNDPVIVRGEKVFTYAEAHKVAKHVSAGSATETVFLDLSRTIQITTAALARLILLRLRLLEMGRELFLVGLHGQAESLYEINRLTRLLPRRHFSKAPQAASLCQILRLKKLLNRRS